VFFEMILTPIADYTAGHCHCSSLIACSVASFTILEQYLMEYQIELDKITSLIVAIIIRIISGSATM
jgi:hypothetical protein